MRRTWRWLVPAVALLMMALVLIPAEFWDRLGDPSLDRRLGSLKMGRSWFAAQTLLQAIGVTNRLLRRHSRKIGTRPGT